jgi:Tol biopolymer transport system component
MKTGWDQTGCGAGTMLLWLLSALLAQADTVLTVSRFDSSLPPSGTAGGNSGAAVFTPDGRYVAFASTAKNLALTNNPTSLAAQFWPSFNVYLRDRTNGTTTLVSINAAGTGGGNADSIPRGISTNGQFVLFESFAGNLVMNLTTGKGDIYVRDVVNGQTLLVSVNTNDLGGNAISQDSVMTPDGRYVAFSSLASDLVPNDTNGIFDVFIRDRVGATSQLVSLGATAAPSPVVPGGSRIPLVTPDGRYVLFYSTATNLVPGVPAVGDLFLRDTLSNITTWVSAGAQGLFSSNSISFNPALSDDGNYVAYEACSVAYPSPAYGVVQRYNRQTGLTDMVSTNAFVQPFLLCENLASLDMTSDGRFIAYVGNAGRVGSTEGMSFTNAVFLWDAQSGSNTLVSINLTNGVTYGAESDLPAVSTNGQYVAFVSSDTNLTTNILNGAYHLYRRDMLAGVTQLVDADTNGAGAGVTADTAAVMSADGSLVAYQSDSANVATNDRNRGFDLFISDFTNQRTELISPRDPTLPSVTPDGSSGVTVYCVSTNGRYVAFTSEADDITANDTNGLWDVYVRDLLDGTNALVSIAPNGFSANGASFEPSISGDGRYVAFSSYASNLVAGDANASEDVFVRDLQGGATTLVSIGLDGVSFGNSNSWQPTISADGRYVLFHSAAQNLASGTMGPGLENIFLRDLHSNITYALGAVSSPPSPFSAAMTPDGRYVALIGRRSNSGANWYVLVWNTQTTSVIYSNLTTSNSNVSISPDGQRVAWWNSTLNMADVASQANRTVATGSFGLNGGIQFSADGNLLVYAVGPSFGANYSPYAYNVYLFNFQAGRNMLISHGYNATTPALGSSDSPAISPDGRFIVYRSSATNLVAGVTNGQPNLFVFDASTGVNSLLTQNNLQTGPADSLSLKPVFSGDGRWVVFQSWSSDLTSFGDFNADADLFAYAFPYLQITPPVSALEGPVLTWPAVPGQTYQVQSVDSLSGGPWQNLSGTLVITGNQASLSNTPSVSSQRYYRLAIQ